MIGAGVLALPAVTSAPGFILSSVAMVVVWGYSLASGMLVAECAGEGRNSVQEMAEASVGKTAGNIMCAAFLASNYLLMVAYICQGASSLPVQSLAVCSPLFTSCINDLHLAPLLFTGVVGCTSLWGPARFVEAANTALVGLIAVSFVGLMATGAPHVDLTSLEQTPDASALPVMLPVAVCALTFQNVVPAVSKNLDGDVSKIKASLAIGSGLPLIACESTCAVHYLAPFHPEILLGGCRTLAYPLLPHACFFHADIMWNAVILGSTSSSDSTNLAAVASPMDALAGTSPTLASLVSVFSISAIITSFWGAAFSLMIELTHMVDALVWSGSLWDTKGQFPMADDARSIDEVARHDQNVKIAATGLVLVPPAMICLACPDSFLSALQYVGIYVDPFMYGLAPAWMAYNLRNDEGHKAQMPGGTAGLVLVAAVTGMYTVWQTFLKMG